MKFPQLKNYFTLNSNEHLVDLDQIINFGFFNFNPILFCFVNNNSYSLNITEQQFDYLIKNSKNFNLQKSVEFSLFSYALVEYELNKKITFKQLNLIYNTQKLTKKELKQISESEILHPIFINFLEKRKIYFEKQKLNKEVNLSKNNKLNIKNKI